MKLSLPKGSFYVTLLQFSDEVIIFLWQRKFSFNLLDKIESIIIIFIFDLIFSAWLSKTLEVKGTFLYVLNSQCICVTNICWLMSFKGDEATCTHFKVSSQKFGLLNWKNNKENVLQAIQVFFLQMNKLKTFSTSVCYILAIGTSAVWRPTLENVSFSHKKNVLYLHISVYVQESVYIFISNLQTLLYEFLGKLSCGWIWRYCLINTRSLKKVIKQRSPWKNVKGWGSWI